MFPPIDPREREEWETAEFNRLNAGLGELERQERMSRDAIDFDPDPDWVEPFHRRHHPECQCDQCYYGHDAWKWNRHPSEY